MTTYDFIMLLSIDDILWDKDFNELCQILAIPLDNQWLEKEYETIPYGQGDVMLFPAPKKDHFILLDLFLSFTDQHNMVVFGVRCSDELRNSVFEKINRLYQKAAVKSDCIQAGPGLLDDYIDLMNYPKKKMTVTKINGKQCDTYPQLLKIINQ